VPDEVYSYADFSVIHRYLEQQRLHDEALAKKDDRVRELELQLQDAQTESERHQQTVQKLSAQTHEAREAAQECSQECERQRQQIHNLQQRVAELQREMNNPKRR
jgi:peptidoglycan hydrolase CwlO-like protein